MSRPHLKLVELHPIEDFIKRCDTQIMRSKRISGNPDMSHFEAAVRGLEEAVRIMRLYSTVTPDSPVLNLQYAVAQHGTSFLLALEDLISKVK